MIQKRVIDIAGCNPDIKVFFNDEEIKIKSFEDYVKFYKPEFFFEGNKEKIGLLLLLHLLMDSNRYLLSTLLIPMMVEVMLTTY
jgi:hypothetical protein